MYRFFDTGTKYIGRIAAWMDANGYPRERTAALDFGCGVGRLTQALCDHFSFCVGVDIAPSMLAKAHEFNRFGTRCVYRLNETDDLSFFPNQSFDMVHTAHVLQHIRPHVAIRYMAEFIRLLKPGGLAAFHCPSAKATFAYPEEGLACALSSGKSPLAMEHGTRRPVPLQVTNTGAHPIGMNKETNAPVRLAHHWYNLDTDEVFKDHGRQNLPDTVLKPGESLTMEYRAASPASPGNYVLTIFAQDYLARSMANPNEALLLIPVLVVPAREQPDSPAPVAVERPYSETHAIPADTVEKVVTVAGGRILHVQSSQHLPGGQVSSIYYATR